jgi:hypothetical protein
MSMAIVSAPRNVWRCNGYPLSAKAVWSNSRKPKGSPSRGSHMNAKTTLYMVSAERTDNRQHATHSRRLGLPQISGGLLDSSGHLLCTGRQARLLASKILTPTKPVFDDETPRGHRRALSSPGLNDAMTSHNRWADRYRTAWTSSNLTCRNPQREN